ncbi:MAG: branched-chain amino acid transport system II carrier protein [Alphaproteobacteria bacterium]|nr:branched-chain amino acid transport system II carrier protein [Alphaproteobacteria bacterium]
MRPYKLVLTAGFAMFSMFFGSGNLVFPLLVGFETSDNYIYAIAGLLVTAVCVPFLGLLGMVQFKGDRKEYFSSLGKIPAFVLTLLMLSLMGPFGVIPRCITVAFGGLQLMIPNLSFSLFSLGFCILTGFLIWQRNRIVNIIGLVLTPFKLGSIVLLILVGLYFGGGPLPSLHSSKEAFSFGFLQGYQTMDLVAGLFFACTIYEYLKTNLASLGSGEDDERRLLKKGIYASLIGALLLSLVYIGFIMLGAEYAPFLKNIPPESMLVEIARHALGHYAVPIVAVTLAISCLATATVLTTLAVDFLQDDISKNRLNRSQSIVIILTVALAMSMLGFQSICSFLGTALAWIYPFLVVYALVQIIRKTTCLKVAQNCQ